MKVKLLSAFLPLFVLANSLFNINSKIHIDEKVINQENKFIKAQVKYPNLYTEDNKYKDKIDKLNNKISDETNIWIKDLKELAIKSENESKSNKYQFNKFQIHSTYKISLNKENIISIPIDYYQYTGGAHGLTTKISYNFDFNNGNFLGLKDLFKKDYDYKKVINEEIKRQIREKSSLYFDDGNSFKGIKNNQDFYLEDDGITVYFQLYEIAPYSSGIREFKIPYSLLKNGI